MTYGEMQIQFAAIGPGHPWAEALLGIVLGIVLLLVLWLSYQRLAANLPRLALVWALNMSAFIGLSALISDVQITKPGVMSATLLTPGTTSVDLAEIDDSQDVLVMADWAAQHQDKPLPERAILIEDIAQLAIIRPQLEHVQIVGDGLRPSQWQSFNALNSMAQQQKLSITFSPSPRRFGPINMSWQKQLAPGEYLQVSGTLQGGQQEAEDQSETSFQLALINPNQQDLAQLDVKAGEEFHLRVPVSVPGQWIYRLQIRKIHTKEILADEPIAINVTSQRPARLVIKQSAPSFETRQLKNWASAFGNRVTVVSQISQHNSIVQQLNMPDTVDGKDKGDPLLNESLHEYDILVMDARALSTMPAMQLEYLHSSIFKGLGLLLMANGSDFTHLKHVQWLNNISLKPLNESRKFYQAVPHWPNSRVNLAIEIPAFKLSAPQTETLVHDDNAHPLVIAKDIGMGNIAVSLINNTYQWQTSGYSSEYSHYWQSLIKQLARSNNGNRWIPPEQGRIFYAGETIALCAMSNGNSLYLQTNEKNSLNPEMFQPNKLCTIDWVQQPGWQGFNLVGKVEAPAGEGVLDRQVRFIYQPHDWQTWQQANSHKASQEAASLSPPLIVKPQLSPINKLYFWYLLCFACSLLWLERKLYLSS